MNIARMLNARNLNFQKSKVGLFIALPLMLDYYQLLTPYTSASTTQIQ